MSEPRTKAPKVWEEAGRNAHSAWSFEYELDAATLERTERIRDAQFFPTPRRLAVPPSQRKAVPFT